MSEFETIKPREQANGRTLTLNGEVCSSWGFTKKKKVIEDIANELADKGYEVKYFVQPVPGGTDIIRLTLVKDDGTKIIIFSNDIKEKEVGGIYAKTMIGKEIEIIDKIMMMVKK